MKPPRRRSSRLLALPAVGYAILILFLSSRPGSDLPNTGIAYGDRWLHVAEYFVFGLLLLLPTRALEWKGRGLSLAVGLAFAAVDEGFQTTVPGRFGDLGDFAMDALGLLLAVALNALTSPARVAANADDPSK